MIKPRVFTVAKVPCKSCPYRKDVPSGVWHKEEYDKLPEYDDCDPAPGLDRIMARLKRFDCHQSNGKLCAGWVGCHGAQNLVALRMIESMGNVVHKDVWDYKSPVPLWESGAAAAAHGKREIRRPKEMTKRMVATLARKLRRGE